MTSGGLRIRLVGRFAVEGVDGHAPGTVPSGRAQHLMAVLAAHQGRFVPTDTLVHALWSDSLPERPERNLAALVSRLRRGVGRERIEGDPSGYRLVRDAGTTVDVHEALDLVQEAERDLERGLMLRAVSGAQTAEDLLGGGSALVGEPDAPWAGEIRRLAAATLSRARSCHWTAALALGEDRTAIDLASRALAADALNEPACRALMRAHMRQGADGAALAAYERLRRALSDELGADPSPATQEIYRSLLHHEEDVEGSALPLRGRDRELAQLRRAWAAANRGHGGLVLVTGEAGIGKSALARVLANEVHAARGLVLEVRCYEAERSLYLQPLAEAVRDLTARQGREPGATASLSVAETEALADLVPELAGPGTTPSTTAEVGHRRTLLAMAELLGRTAELHPILLVVEDLHHAGQTTLEALHVLAIRLAARRVLVVALERSAEERSGAENLLDVATHLEIGPLPRAVVSELLSASGARYDPDDFLAWTGGSPLLVGELLRHPEPPPADGSGPVIPGTLHELLTRRLEVAAPDVALLLGQAAVLGSSFSLDDVAALAGVDPEECARRAERAVRAGLLIPDGERFRFPNDIMRAVAYSGVETPVRISRHRRAAELVADRPEAAAAHHSAAGDHRAAALAWVAAADAARLAFAHLEAERLLTSALDSAACTGDRALRVTVLLRRGQTRCDLARYDEAHEDHAQALELARELGDEESEARALEALGWTALWARDAFAAVDLAERAGHLAESAAAAPGARRSSLLLLGRVRHWDGDYSGATHAYQQVLAVEADDALGAVAMSYRGALLQHMDRFAEARAVLERAVALCARTGEFRTLLQSLFFCGLARGDEGDFAGALRALDRARRLIDEAGVGYYRAGIETTTSWLWQELGDLGRAREHAEAAVDLARRGGGALELEQELHALLALADCALLAGHDDDAGAMVEAAAPALDRSLPFRPRAAMRLLEMQARWEPERAEELLTQATTYRSTKYEALALAHLGRAEEAAAAARRTRSDLVVAQAGAPGARGPARARIAAGLPPELRSRFVTSGRLVVPQVVR